MAHLKCVDSTCVLNLLCWGVQRVCTLMRVRENTDAPVGHGHTAILFLSRFWAVAMSFKPPRSRFQLWLAMWDLAPLNRCSIRLALYFLNEILLHYKNYAYNLHLRMLL